MSTEKDILDAVERDVLPAALPLIVDLFRHGGRDLVLSSLDAGLKAARSKTDADLEAKHAHDHDAANTTPVEPPPDSSHRDILVTGYFETQADFGAAVQRAIDAHHRRDGRKP